MPTPHPSNLLDSETRSARRCSPPSRRASPSSTRGVGSVRPLVVTSGPMADPFVAQQWLDRPIAPVIGVRCKAAEGWSSLAETKVTRVHVVVAADEVSGVPVGPMVQSVGPTNPIDGPPITTVDARPPTSVLLYYSGRKADLFAGRGRGTAR
jgi:hypothetical protein